MQILLLELRVSDVDKFPCFTRATNWHSSRESCCAHSSCQCIIGNFSCILFRGRTGWVGSVACKLCVGGQSLPSRDQFSKPSVLLWKVFNVLMTGKLICPAQT